MNLKNLFMLGLKGMEERKFRAALTILSVVIGVAAIVALISMTAGISQSISQSLNKIGPTTLFISPSQSTILTGADVAEIESFPNVSSVVPMIRFSANITVSGKSDTVTVLGVDSASLESVIGSVSLYEGTTYNETGGPTAVVGHNIAFPNTGQTEPSLQVAQPIYLSIPGRSGTKSATLVPVGILDPYGTSFFVSPDSSIFIPLQEAESLLGRYSYNMLVVKATNTSTVASLDYLLGNVYNGRADVLSVEQLTSTVASITGSLGLLLGGIAGISLLVAGISILSIMMVSVTERTHEIGILKSIGFRRKDVMFLFLSEAVIIGFVGGILGSALGSAGSYALLALLSSGSHTPTAGTTGASGAQSFGGGGVQRGGAGNGVYASRGSAGGSSFGAAPSGGFSFKPSVSPTVIGIAILLAVVVSTLSSLYPAWKASKIDPIRALRSE